MGTGVHLGVVLGPLRHAPQAVQLGQQPGQRAAVAQHLHHSRRVVFHQPARQLLPHALGHQGVDLTVGHHLPHQRQRLGRQREGGKARCEARHAQQAHRVFDERFRHVAQHAGSQVALAAVRVHQMAVGTTRHGVDRQVAPRQVLLQRHLGAGVEDEAVVAPARLAFGACQRHLFVRLGVQEDREVAPHGLIAGGQQRLGRGAHGDPVAVGRRAAQQLVAHRAAHDEQLHGGAQPRPWR